MNVTIFCMSLLGMGIGRCSGRLLTHGVAGPPSALQKKPFVEFVPLKKRKARTITDESYLLVLQGYEIPDPPAPFIAMPSQSSISPLSCPTGGISFDCVYTFEGTRKAFDPEYITEFNRFINQFSSRFVVDYRCVQDAPCTNAPLLSRGQPDIDKVNAEQPPLLTEGKVSVRFTRRYERDPEVRWQCIAAHGSSCTICGFDFGRTYGDVGKGHIHVHHLVPLCESEGEHTVNPITDLRPVCPNCHAMLHLREPPYKIEEVLSMLN